MQQANASSRGLGNPIPNLSVSDRVLARLGRDRGL